MILCSGFLRCPLAERLFKRGFISFARDVYDKSVPSEADTTASMISVTWRWGISILLRALEENRYDSFETAERYETCARNAEGAAE